MKINELKTNEQSIKTNDKQITIKLKPIKTMNDKSKSKKNSANLRKINQTRIISRKCHLKTQSTSMRNQLNNKSRLIIHQLDLNLNQ